TMTFDEAGDDTAPFQIDDLSLGSRQGAKRLVAADGHELAFPDGERLGHGFGGVQGDDLSVDEKALGCFRGEGGEGESEGGEGGAETFHGGTVGEGLRMEGEQQ